MPRLCSVCCDPNRDAIEAATIAGTSSRAIASAHGLDHRAVHRHARNHLPAAIRAAATSHVAHLNAIVMDATESPIAIAEPAEAAEAGSQVGRQGANPRLRVRPGRVLIIEDGPSAPSADLQPVATLNNAAPPPMGVLALVHDLRDRALAILAQAEMAGDPKTALAAIREARGLLETLARLEPPPRADAGAALATTSEWTRVRTALLSALAPFPEARLAAATALASTGALA